MNVNNSMRHPVILLSLIICGTIHSKAEGAEGANFTFEVIRGRGDYSLFETSVHKMFLATDTNTQLANIDELRSSFVALCSNYRRSKSPRNPKEIDVMDRVGAWCFDILKTRNLTNSQIASEMADLIHSVAQTEKDINYAPEKTIANYQREAQLRVSLAEKEVAMESPETQRVFELYSLNERGKLIECHKNLLELYGQLGNIEAAEKEEQILENLEGAKTKTVRAK